MNPYSSGFSTFDYQIEKLVYDDDWRYDWPEESKPIVESRPQAVEPSTVQYGRKLDL